MRPMGIVTSLVLALLVAGTSPAMARATARFDFDKHVVQELSRPNVRMVAVVFSAAWCEACRSEEAEWKRLKATFGARGLRLVVVRYKDAQQRLKVYDWPDV